LNISAQREATRKRADEPLVNCASYSYYQSVRIEVTLGELEDGVPIPLDERSTLVLVPSAVVEVKNSAGEPVPDERVLVSRADGRVEVQNTDSQGLLKLYGKKNEVFNVTLVGRPKGQQGEAKHAGGNMPHAKLLVTAPDGTVLANEEVLIERANGKRETYYTDAAGQVRLFGEPGEQLKVCLVKQPKGHVTAGAETPLES
jgi:hypothetical protein